MYHISLFIPLSMDIAPQHVHFKSDSMVKKKKKKKSTCQCKKHTFDPWIRKSPSKKWQPTPEFLPGKSHGQMSLASYSPWGHKELETPEWQSPHTVNGHLGCFHVLAVVYSAVVNTEVHLSLWIMFFLHICPGVELLGHMVALLLVFKEPPYCSP